MQPSVLPGRAYDPILLESRAMLAVRAADFDLVGVGGELPTFIRNTAGGSVIDAIGQLYTPVYGQPRFQMVDLDGDGVRETPVLVIEPQSTNRMLQSENFSATWGLFGTGTVQSAAKRCGDVVLDRLEDTSAANRAEWHQNPAFVGNGEKVITVLLARGLTPASLSTVHLHDGTAGQTRAYFNVSWSAQGVPTFQNVQGTIVRSYHLRDGIYLISLRSNGSVTAANANKLYIIPAEVSSQTGDLYVGGVHCEDASYPTSYIKTTTAVATRNADILRYTIDGLIPQEMTVYLKIRDRGTYYTPQARLLQISAADNNGPKFMLYTSSGNAYLALHQNANGGATVSSTITPAPAIDAVVELCAQFYEDGAVQIHGVVNAGGVVSGAKSAALAPAAAWSGTIVHVGANALGTEVSNFQLLELRIVPGVRSLTQCREIL